MRWLTLGLAALLTACALPPPASDTARSSYEARRIHLEGMTHWSLTGRIAVSAEGEGWSAGLHWWQSGEDYRISVFDALGRTLARIQGRPGGVRLRTAEGRQAEAADAERLLAEALGWELPLRGLRYWVRGLPLPNQPLTRLQLDADGRPRLLEQDGWSVSYPRYQTADHAALPGRVVLERSPLKVKLAVDKWRLGE